MRKRQAGILISVVQTLLGGLTFFCSKGMLVFYNAESSSFLWLAFAAASYTIYMTASRQLSALKMIRHYYREVLKVGFFSSIGGLLWFYGTELTEPTNVAFVFQFSRPFAALMAIFVLHEKLLLKEKIGIALAFTGALILTYGGNESEFWATLVILAAAFSLAISFVLAKIYVKDMDPLVLAAGRTFVMFVAMLVYSVSVNRLQLDVVSLEGLGWGITGAVIGPFLQMILFYEALERLEISKVVGIISIQPFFTLLWSMAFFSAFPDSMQLLGGSVATIGVTILSTASETKH